MLGKDSTDAQKSEATLKKQLKKTAAEKEKEKDDAIVEISAESVLMIAPNGEDSTTKTTKERVKKKKKKKNGKIAASPEKDIESDDSDGNSEVEEQERQLSRGKGLKAFEQRDLVAKAFAGDNVVRVSLFLRLY